jgi:hypothetical protein
MSWLIIIVITGFFVLLTMRLFPLYYESFAVERSLREVATDKALSPRNPREVRDSLRKRFNLNEIDSVEAEDLKIEKVGDGFSYRLEYEDRVPFAGNLYIVGKFRMTETVED